MKSNSKGVLKIKQLSIAVLLITTIATCAQSLIKNNGIELANVEGRKLAENEIITEDVQIAQATIDRGDVVTSRSATINRNEVAKQENVTETVPEKVYKSIDEITISRSMDLTQRCGVSKEDFKTLIGNTSADTTKFFYNNSDTIYDLCEKYEINEVFFCGLIAGESGWNIASNHRTKCNYISMMGSSGNMITYSSVDEGLEAAAKLLHNRYLTEGGSYYNGKTLSAVQKIFCPNSSTWVNLIYTCMSKIVK